MNISSSRPLKAVTWSVWALICLFSFSCAKSEEEMRSPSDILGVWSPSSNEYFNFKDNYIVAALYISYEDGEEVAEEFEDVYLYEPGYNLVVYLNTTPSDNSSMIISVYEIVSMTQSKLTWCWVKDIEINPDNANKDTVGKVMGQIINEAQEGFTLDPELYQTFTKIPESTYKEIRDRFPNIY